MAITIENIRYEHFSFRYTVGYDLITYLHDGEPQSLYCDRCVSSRDVVRVIYARENGLEHLVRQIIRWPASSCTIIITS